MHLSYQPHRNDDYREFSLQIMFYSPHRTPYLLEGPKLLEVERLHPQIQNYTITNREQNHPVELCA
jgi:hypothetical protein